MLSIIVSSCATKDQVVYFNNVQKLEGQVNLLEYEPKIERNDVLRINVSSSSVNEEIVAPFQMNQQGNQSGGGGGQNLSLTGYLVSPKGTINFPVLGTVDVVGLTRTEIQEKLQKEGPTMSDDEKLDAQKRLNSLSQDANFLNQKLTTMRNELMQLIQNEQAPKFQKVVSELMRAKGIKILLHRQSVLGFDTGDPTLNLTPEITELLNQKEE